MLSHEDAAMTARLLPHISAAVTARDLGIGLNLLATFVDIHRRSIEARTSSPWVQPLQRNPKVYSAAITAQLMLQGS